MNNKIEFYYIGNPLVIDSNFYILVNSNIKIIVAKRKADSSIYSRIYKKSPAYTTPGTLIHEK